MAEKKSSKKSNKPETRGRKKGSCGPALDPKAIHTEPGDNTKYIYAAMALWDLPKVDLKDAEAVAERTNAYFSMMAERDMKPTVIGYAMALGIDRKTLWAIVNDQPYSGRGYVYELPPNCAHAIKNGYRTMEFLWENYMQNRQIETVSGIFLGKNHYGYKDQQETVVVTPNLLGDGADQKQLEQRYLDSVVVEEN